MMQCMNESYHTYMCRKVLESERRRTEPALFIVESKLSVSVVGLYKVVTVRILAQIELPT